MSCRKRAGRYTLLQTLFCLWGTEVWGEVIFPHSLHVRKVNGTEDGHCLFNACSKAARTYCYTSYVLISVLCV
uniref:Secreted protein n=1 Tax=Anguilla anguilla TaxID=7936 RepID=A0A0E9TPE5_ANGAN